MYTFLCIQYAFRHLHIYRDTCFSEEITYAGGADFF